VRRLNLTVLFVVGGDGSHRLAAAIAAAAAEQGMRLRFAPLSSSLIFHTDLSLALPVCRRLSIMTCL
jgi:hypothetical protein